MIGLDTIKHAPRWAWWTAGGISAGALGLHVWRNRAAGPATQTASDGSTAADPASVQPATTGASPAGVIVPPVIAASDSSVGDIAGGIAGMFGGAITDLTGLVGSVVQGNQLNINDLITGQTQITEDAIGALANGGGPPGSARNNPPPITINLPPPSRPPASHPVTMTKCGDKWPGHPHHDPTRGKVGAHSCYHNRCVDDGHNHHHREQLYADGTKKSTGDCTGHKAGATW